MPDDIQQLVDLLPSHWEVLPTETLSCDDGRDYEKPMFMRKDGLARIYFNDSPDDSCVFSIAFDFHYDGDCRSTLDEAIMVADHYIATYPLELKVFLDDERKTPEGWDRCYDVSDAICYLQTRCVTHLSVDNDLGSLETATEGFNVLNWLEEQVFNDSTFPVPEITVHSSNAARVQSMLATVESIKRLKIRNE